MPVHEEWLFFAGGMHKVCWAAIALQNGEFKASEAARKKSFHAEFQRLPKLLFPLVVGRALPWIWPQTPLCIWSH